MRKIVKESESVPVNFSENEIELILEYTLVEDDIIEKFNVAEVVGKSRKVYFTLYELEDLNGHIAAIANHTENKKLQARLDKIFDKIQKVEEKYELDYE